MKGANTKKPDYLESFKYEKPINVKEKLKLFMKNGYDEAKMDS